MHFNDLKDSSIVNSKLKISSSSYYKRMKASTTQVLSLGSFIETIWSVIFNCYTQKHGLTEGKGDQRKYVRKIMGDNNMAFGMYVVPSSLPLVMIGGPLSCQPARSSMFDQFSSLVTSTPFDYQFVSVMTYISH